MIIDRLQTHWEMCHHFRSQDLARQSIAMRYFSARSQVALHTPTKISKAELKALRYVNPRINNQSSSVTR